MARTHQQLRRAQHLDWRRAAWRLRAVFYLGAWQRLEKPSARTLPRPAAAFLAVTSYSRANANTHPSTGAAIELAIRLIIIALLALLALSLFLAAARLGQLRGQLRARRELARALALAIPHRRERAARQQHVRQLRKRKASKQARNG